MELDKSVLEKIDLINAVLKEIGIHDLLQKTDFEFEKENYYAHYINCHLKKENSIPLSIVLSYSELEIKLDRAHEILQWSNDQITQNRSEIKDWIKTVLTNSIRVKHCGSNYTRLQFLDKMGNVTKSLKYITGIYIKIG